MAKTIYLVVAEFGEYDGYSKDILCAFFDINDAKHYIAKAQEANDRCFSALRSEQDRIENTPWEELTGTERTDDALIVEDVIRKDITGTRYGFINTEEWLSRHARQYGIVTMEDSTFKIVEVEIKD